MANSQDLLNEETPGFVSREFLRFLLIVGIITTGLNIAVLIAVKAPTILIYINIILFICWITTFILLKRVLLKYTLFFTLTVLTLGIQIGAFTTEISNVWLPLIPLCAFAMFGDKIGLLWTKSSLFVYCLGLFTAYLILQEPLYSLYSSFVTISNYIVVSIMAWHFMEFSRNKQEETLKAVAEKERLEVAQNLAGGVAHLINNEMQVVSGALFLINTHSGDEKVKSLTERIATASNKASGHANQLLAYAHGGQYSRQEFNLIQFINNIIETWNTNESSGISIQQVPNQVIPLHQGDSSQISQVLLSIFHNANEAIHQKHSLDAYAGEQGEIKVLFNQEQPDNNMFVITIKDNGIGIEPGDLDKVFEPYFSTKFTGRGMGLAAAQGIIKNHGGKITLESSLNEGTAVHIYLPSKNIEH